MRRVTHWDIRLMEFVDRTRHEPFRWSWQDCSVWALRAIDAMCGTAHAAAIRDQYATEDGALDYAASRGWATGADACREFLGAPLPRVAAMTRGDVLYRPLPTFPFGTLLVRVDSEILMGPGEQGLVAWPRRAALAGTMTAYAVGR